MKARIKVPKIATTYFRKIFILLAFSLVLNTNAEALDIQATSSDKQATLIAVGDIMMHKAELDGGYDKETNSYNFSTFFKYINSYLKDGDIVYANLETPVAGSELKYTGYPTFNAPLELLTELKNNYFTHLSLANNHALDRGATGLGNTVKNVASIGFVGLGARSDKKPNYEITEVNGLRIGFLSYTYGTNGFKLSGTNSYMLSYIDKDKVAKDIKDLKSQGVDVTVVTFHFGEEYKRTENNFQRQIAKLACDNGADIVLGAHPHVLEPIVFMNNHKCLVAYSLGNFISAMSATYTDVAGILKIEINKHSDNTLSLKPDFMGTWVKKGLNPNGTKYYSVVPLDADKIPSDIKVTKAEQDKLIMYRKFINTKIKTYK